MTDPGEIAIDWKQAHAELIRIGKAKSGLDWEEGRWLLVAVRTAVHRRLGLGTFAEYAERMLGHGPRTTEEKLRVVEVLERLSELSQALQSGAHIGRPCASSRVLRCPRRKRPGSPPLRTRPRASSNSW